MYIIIFLDIMLLHTYNLYNIVHQLYFNLKKDTWVVVHNYNTVIEESPYLSSFSGTLKNVQKGQCKIMVHIPYGRRSEGCRFWDTWKHVGQRQTHELWRISFSFELRYLCIWCSLLCVAITNGPYHQGLIMWTMTPSSTLTASLGTKTDKVRTRE